MDRLKYNKNIHVVKIPRRQLYLKFGLTHRNILTKMQITAASIKYPKSIFSVNLSLISPIYLRFRLVSVDSWRLKTSLSDHLEAFRLDT